MKIMPKFSMVIVSLAMTLLSGYSAMAEGDPVEGGEGVSNNPLPTSTSGIGDIACIQTQSNGDASTDLVTYKLKLSYLRDAQGVIQALNEFTEQSQGQPATKDCNTYLTSYDNNTIVFRGDEEVIKRVQRIVAVMDLPRPGVAMEVYGIQISSNDPNDMAKAMSQVRREISKTQLLIRETYTSIQDFARFITVDEEFQRLLEQNLGYKFALDTNRPLSLTDILILLNAADVKKDPKDPKDPSIAVRLANSLNRKFQQERFADYTKALSQQGLCPLEGFFRSRGLRLKSDLEGNSQKQNKNNKQCDWEEASDCDWEEASDCDWEEAGPFVVKKSSMATRTAILDFALHYAHYVTEPNDFDAYSLQQSADLLNTSLRATTNIINRDIENMFMQPTLDNIREIVSDFNDVTYAQIGKTSVAGLSGLESSAGGTVESIFDVTPPLRILDLLEKASTNREKFQQLLPSLISPINFGDAVGTTPAASETSGAETPSTTSGNSTASETSGTETPSTTNNTVNSSKSPISSFEPMIGGVLPLTSFLGLLTAYDEDRSQRLILSYEGPNLTVTPYVLPNMSSAEIKFDLIVGDPEISSEDPKQDDNDSGDNGNPEQKDAERLVNLSRIKSHTANSTVYVDAVDFFTISTFSSQNSIDGGRGYFPLIGTIWRGVFSDIPLIGNLFSWKKNPQTVLHESMLITNSYIK